MNGIDILTLSKYAHETLQPIVDQLRTGKASASLYIGMDFHDDFPGVSIWIHQHGTESPGCIVDYEANNVSEGSIDALAARLPRKWEEALKAEA